MALVAGCQGHSSEELPVVAPPSIEVRTSGVVGARLVPGHPCRATIDGTELLVGEQPLVAQVGTVRWTGDDAANGTQIARDGVAAARVFAGAHNDSLGIFDANGVTLVQATIVGTKAIVSAADGTLLRTLVRTPQGISVGDVTVTGTDDLLLAALLTAPEVGPEVRGLAACHRVLPIVKGS